MRTLTRTAIVVFAFLFLLGIKSNPGLSQTDPTGAFLENPNQKPVETQDIASLPNFAPSPQPAGLTARASQLDDTVMACTLIDFEGLGNHTDIPAFDGISSPDWLALIDSDAGGTGNFANEPSPSTVAFWLSGDPKVHDILFARPVLYVGFFYTSTVDITLKAFDKDNKVVASASGLANFNQGEGDPNGYHNKWDPIEVRTTTRIITKVRVSGNENETGIDNLKVCTDIGINSVEFTQAIQIWQNLKDFRNGIQDDKEPPVPVVAQKPMALRVYMEEVKTTTRVSAQLSGVAIGTVTVDLQPNCTPEQSRRQQNGCRSIDFYFTPPQGEWTATLRTFDKDDILIERFDFTIASVTTNPLILEAVSVCDSINTAGEWRCADASTLSGLIDFLARIAPTHDVQVTNPGHVVRRNIHAGYTQNIDWWVDIVTDINNLGANRYYGMVRSQVPGGIGGIAHDIPSRGAASRVSAVRLGVETNDGVVAHETGHTLGRKHTNTDDPRVFTNPPGCYNMAEDSSTDWIYSDNLIRSGSADHPVFEVGFDVANHLAIDPENTYEVMSYCTPRWISPLTYIGILNTLRASPSPSPSSLSDGTFWRIAGSIDEDTARLSPLFTFETQGSLEPGSGTHRIEVRSQAGALLFTRYFTPNEVVTETTESDIRYPVFSELVQVQPGAKNLLIFNESNAQIGAFTLGGISPSVLIAAPPPLATLSGMSTISWSITDADSADHVSKVQYSLDGGATWLTIADGLTEKSLKVDFDQLPGSNVNAHIRVFASDGANTGLGVSAPFTVTKKQPQAEIIFPASGFISKAGALVWLQGSASDLDDGTLPQNNIKWQSSRDGLLGFGQKLAVTTLSEGHHTITLTVEDLDHNLASDTVELLIDGIRPTLNLSVTPDGTPASCVAISISAADNPGGSGIEQAQYSFDGGLTWISIDPSRLPLNFRAPGNGFIHLIVRVADRAQNLAIDDSKFFIYTPCANTAPTAKAGTNYSGLEGQSIALDGSQSVDPGGTIILYEWDLDDDNVYDDALGATASVSFPDNGFYLVKLRVTDNDNAASIDDAQVVVSNVAPTVEAGENLKAVVGTAVSLANATFTDPGLKDTHTASIDWGDQVVENAAFDDHTITATHHYSQKGDFTVEVCVQDDDGGEGCDTATITVDLLYVFLPLAMR